MSLFSDALGTILAEVHRAQGSPVITYQRAGSDPFALVGVFDAQGTELDMATGAVVRTGEPRLGIRLSDLGAITPQQGDLVTVAGSEYVVSDIDPDGQGGASLHLRRL